MQRDENPAPLPGRVHSADVLPGVALSLHPPRLPSCTASPFQAAMGPPTGNSGEPQIGRCEFPGFVDDQPMRSLAVGVIALIFTTILLSVKLKQPHIAPDGFAMERLRMVREQLEVPARGITNARVLEVMGQVPRHEFIPKGVMAGAYEDRPLPIGFSQTISQPYIVAFMTEKLDPQPHDRVLEIGTGSGYQAAVLSGLVEEVYTIEIVEALAERASVDLDRLVYTNVHVRAGDGYQGWPDEAPFDAIIVTCAPNAVPQPLVNQLAEGGRMIIPVGPGLDQKLILLHKTDGELEQKAVLPVRFVPMTGKAQK